MKLLPAIICRVGCLLFSIVAANSAFSFDYAGHRLINQLALASLPGEFPGFVRQADAAERIAFLAGEPDRWRNSPDPGLQHANKPDHYLDVEFLEPLGFDVHALPPLRYQFVVELAEARRKLGNRFPTVNPQTNRDHTQELVGFLPWSIDEYFSKIKSAFSALKAFEEAGTPEEIANAQQNAIYCMGVLGHYVGDAAQPLHTTKYFNGWSGENPGGFTTSHGFHAWIDGGYAKAVGVELEEIAPRVRPATLIKTPDAAAVDPGVFSDAMEYILAQHKLVEPLYQLEKDGGFTPDKPNGLEGKKFLERQYLAAAQMLGDLWFTAWKEAPMDGYLRSYLARRK